MRNAPGRSGGPISGAGPSRRDRSSEQAGNCSSQDRRLRGRQSHAPASLAKASGGESSPPENPAGWDPRAVAKVAPCSSAPFEALSPGKKAIRGDRGNGREVCGGPCACRESGARSPSLMTESSGAAEPGRHTAERTVPTGSTRPPEAVRRRCPVPSSEAGRRPPLAGTRDRTDASGRGAFRYDHSPRWVVVPVLFGNGWPKSGTKLPLSRSVRYNGSADASATNGHFGRGASQ